MNDTYQLQSYCWYNIAQHFGLRGGEVFAKFTKNDIVFERDSDGVEHVKLKSDFLTKNTPGGLNGRDQHMR